MLIKLRAKRALFIIILVLYACIGVQADATATPHHAVLLEARQIASSSDKLIILYPHGSKENIIPVARAFTEATGVPINYIETTVDDINTHMLINAAQENYEFDIALPATFGIPDLVEAGCLADLTSFYHQSGHSTTSLYNLGDTYKGKQYGFQTDGDVYLMFYNRLMLDNPEEQQAFAEQYQRPLVLPQTWAELDQLMAFFHRPEQGQFGGCLFRTPRYMVWEWWIRFHEYQVFPVDDQFHPNIANEYGVNALESLIAATQFQHPSASQNGLFDNWHLYSSGTCFANIGWGGTQKYLNNQLAGKLYHQTSPGVSYFNWGWNYVVSEFSPQKKLAFLFCLYATSSIGSLDAIRADGFFDPFLSEHYQDPIIQSVYTPAFLQAHEAGMRQAIPDFYVEGQGRYISVLQEAISAAHSGHVSAAEALQFASRRWQDITNSIGRNDQIGQWLRLKQRYPSSFQNK